MIDDKVQRTRAGFNDEGEDNFEAPEMKEWIFEKQLIGGGKVSRVSSYVFDGSELRAGNGGGILLPKNQMFSY